MAPNEHRKLSLGHVLVLFRLINCFFVQSFFQPDEFWQCLEPAHYMAFGYGNLTWEWKFGLRSYAIPLVFELIYRMVKGISKIVAGVVFMAANSFAALVNLLAPNSDLGWEMAFEMQQFPREIKEFLEYQGVLWAPKIFMALLGAVGEWYMIEFVDKVLSRAFNGDEKDKARTKTHIRIAASILSMTNFFNYFMITRTFANSFETALTSIALYYWDWTAGQDVGSRGFTVSLFFGILLCFLRPTNALIWVSLGVYLLLNLILRHDTQKLFKLGRKLFSVFSLVLLLNLGIDYYFYGHLSVPAYRFIKFNYTSALSSFYGAVPWHFHLLQSLPLILGFSIPLFIYGFFFMTFKKTTNLLDNTVAQIRTVVIINILAFSTISHKEFRFLYTLQPLLTLYSSAALGQLIPKIKEVKNAFLKSIIWSVPFISIFSALAILSFQEVGVIEVTKYLHNIPKIHSVGFIMPCHSTPWQSHIHRQDIADLWAITCEPPLHLLNDPDGKRKLLDYMDESDHLYEDIPKFVYKNFPPVFKKGLRSPGKAYAHEWPEYLVLFQHLDEEFMNKFLEDSGYLVEKRFFNSLKHWDSRRSGDVIVYHKPPWV
ncbi:LAQU0S04e07734g1_1 [Lachancea quebecensis]|uniref:Mannosyltransferase n=1 Tax=Lachancea quebecensis TaxID=1654605 RepID=A0A0P1KZR8_9SACH|nr:LAQU0S04e07734g1_1 [Lachancea quebecensis]